MAADPQWLRSSLCEDLAQMDRVAGRIPDTRTIERVVDRDIAQWAAVNREAKPVMVKREEREDDACLEVAQLRAEQCAQKTQHTSELRAGYGGPVKDEIVAPPCPCGMQCKKCRMWARIRTITEGIPFAERKRVGPLMWQNCKHPGLAEEVYRVWAAVQRAPGVSPKRQRFMSDEDLNKWAQRQLENICDRSNAIPGLGAWWVR